MDGRGYAGGGLRRKTRREGIDTHILELRAPAHRGKAAPLSMYGAAPQ
jgi:hypothetical protein